MALFSGLLRWHENAEKRRREKSGFVRFPGLLATACRPLATVGLLSSGSVLFSTPSLLEIYVAARHVPHRHDTNIPWEREPPNNLHADGLTDIDIEEDEDTRKASSFVVLSTGVVEQVSEEFTTAAGTVTWSRAQLEELEKQQRDHLEKFFDNLKKQADKGEAQADKGEADRRRERSEHRDAAGTSGEAALVAGTLPVTPELSTKLQDLQQEYVASLGTQHNLAREAEGQIENLRKVQEANAASHADIEERMQNLEESLRKLVNGMGELQSTYANLRVGFDAGIYGLQAVNGAKFYPSADLYFPHSDAAIRIVPLAWSVKFDRHVDWAYPFQQIDSNGNGKVADGALSKTVQYVKIPNAMLSHARPWRSYYRIAIDGSSKGADWMREWDRQIELLNDVGLFKAMCYHEYDVSAAFKTDLTNTRITESYEWNACFDRVNENNMKSEVGQDSITFQQQIRTGERAITIISIGRCTGFLHLNTDPCTVAVLRDPFSEGFGGSQDQLTPWLQTHVFKKEFFASAVFKNPDDNRLLVKCGTAKGAPLRTSDVKEFRKVLVEFWWRGNDDP
ncbi:unnamed protein product [Amoebophrya sp. A25]|nr:unnamed protein product [Amoebophrya sp. A25]|eukprot:GSA25T00019869001.1